jgi:hypothetical protein
MFSLVLSKFIMFIIFFCNHLNLTQSLTPPFRPPTACILWRPRSIIFQPDMQKNPTGVLYQGIQHFVDLCWTLPKKFPLYYQGIFFLMRIPIRVLVSAADQSTWSPIGYWTLTWTVLPLLNLPDTYAGSVQTQSMSSILS